MALEPYLRTAIGRGDPWAHVDLYALFWPTFIDITSRLTLVQQEEQKRPQKEMEDPLALFMYAFI